MGLDEKEQKVINEINDAIKAIRDKTELLEGQGKSQGTINAEIKDLIGKATKKIDELEVAQKKIHIVAVGTKVESIAFKELLGWMRTGKLIENQEVKLMRLSDATLGGYMTTPEVSNELLKGVIEYSPIREIARVRTTSKESVKIRKRTGVFSAAWTGEKGTKTETTGLTYGLEEVPNHELYALVDITNSDLEDSDFNLETELNAEFSEQFGVAEGLGYVSGNANGKPEGFLTNALVGHVASGDAGKITADGLFKLYFAPKSAYTKNLKFVMNRATMLEISILKSAVDGQYLLRRLGDSPVWNILGAQVVEAKDMPNIAAGTFPVAAGDFQKGYVIVDRIAIAILRDPYTQAATNSVRFHARKRVGGQVVMPEAIYKLEIAAT